MNKKLLVTTLLAAATAASSSLSSRPSRIGDSLDEIFQAIGEDFKRIPLMVLPQAPQSLKQVTSKNANEYRYELAIPGKNADHVSAQVDNETGVITVSIKGESQDESEAIDENGVVYKRTVSSSSQAFEQSFKAPRDSDLNKVQIDVKDGLLTLTISKLVSEKGSRRSIPVNGVTESETKNEE